MNILKSIILLFTVLTTNAFPAQQKDICRYTKTPAGYLMVFRQGDDVIAGIENLAKKENIPSASFTGIG